MQECFPKHTRGNSMNEIKKETEEEEKKRRGHQKK